MLSSDRVHPPNNFTPNFSTIENSASDSGSFQKVNHNKVNIRNVATISSEEMAQNVLKRSNDDKIKQSNTYRKDNQTSEQQASEMLRKYAP